MNAEMNQLNKAQELLRQLLAHMGVEGEVEGREEEDRFFLEIHCEEVERLIGRRGQTIDAIQHLVGKMLARQRSERGKPVTVDIDGYRERCAFRLEALAAKMASKALSVGKPVKLSPMNAYDRRIVHMAIKDMEGLSTKSEGEGENRCVVVIPEL